MPTRDRAELLTRLIIDTAAVCGIINRPILRGSIKEEEKDLDPGGISVVGENGNVSFYEDYRGGYCDFDDNFYVSNFIFIKELLSEI